jgi:hypothetical protein
MPVSCPQRIIFLVQEVAMPADDDKLPFPKVMVLVFGVMIAAILTLLVYVAVSS